MTEKSGSISRSIGGRALAGVLALAGWLAAGPVPAAPVPWLYDVDVAVEGRTPAARLAVSGVALAEVLSRASGLAHVPRNARVREALDRPEAFYSRFVFLENDELRIHFTPGAILGLLDEARLPVWSANRPQIMAWLVVEDGGNRRVVDGEHPLARALSARARQRGLVLKLPLMDLEDRMRVQPAVVRGRLFSSLEEASRRYGADVILAGQVQERACEIASPEDVDPETPAGADSAVDSPESAAMEAPGRPGPKTGSDPGASLTGETPTQTGPVDGPDRFLVVSEMSARDDSAPGLVSGASLEAPPSLESAAGLEAPVAEIPWSCGPAGGRYYSASLHAWMGGDEFAAEFDASDIAEAGLMTADFIADELAGRFAVLARQPNSVGLTIVGIDSPVGYGRLLGYLDGLEFVSSVIVAAVEADRLEITLHTRAGLEQLVELFDRDGRIRPDPENAAVLIWRGR